MRQPGIIFTCAHDPAFTDTEIVHAVRGQLGGLRLDESVIGTAFELRIAEKRIRLTLTAIDGQLEISSTTRVFIESPAAGVLKQNAPSISEVPLEISDGLRQYVSHAEIALPSDTHRWHAAEASIARLHGPPARAVIGDLITRLRGTDWLSKWSEKHYGRTLLSLEMLRQGSSLIMLHGDPGTGKTEVMKNAGPIISRVLAEPVLYIQLNERLRGQGIQGRAGSELAGVLETINRVIGRLALPTIIFLDEAESVASSRSSDGLDSGAQENVAVVDGLIVALDRAVVAAPNRLAFVMATNLVERIDFAVMRRATAYEFRRPSQGDFGAIVADWLGDLFGPADLNLIVGALIHGDRPLTASDILHQVIGKGLREAVMSDTTLSAERLSYLASVAVETRSM